MFEKIVRWLGGYPRIEGVNMPPPGTHYVAWSVDGQIFTTEDMPKEAAEIMAKNLGGTVFPAKLEEENGQE